MSFGTRIAKITDAYKPIATKLTLDNKQLTLDNL